MNLLYILTTAAAVLLLFAGVRMEYLKHRSRNISTTEWRQRLAMMDTVKPMKTRIEGKSGVVSSLKKQRPRLQVMKRKMGGK
jgi:hypothetical protein